MRNKAVFFSLMMATLLCTFACKKDKGDNKKNYKSEDVTNIEVNDAVKAVQDKLYDEVMFIHDEVMPKMTNITGLTKELKGKKSKLVNSKCEFENEDEAKINKVLDRLSVAEEEMWDWMHEFKRPEEGSHEEIMQYLEGEKIKIDNVRQNMLASIRAAETLKTELY